jgi:hypothetical protein
MYVVPDPTYMYVCSHHSLCRPSPTQQLKHVLNTVAINQPTWGQLGCNGFIILDQKGHVKCNKTMAFMQHREAAFEQLIALMDAMLNSNESDFNAALTGIALTGHATGSSNDAEPEGG